MTPLPPASPAVPDPDERALLLLLRAVDTLAADERTEVLMFLLRRGLGTGGETLGYLSVGSSVRGVDSSPIPVSPRPPGRPGSALVDFQPGRPVSLGRTTGQQMVPVRFSTESHQRLRAWCGQHGFPMAAVVRGLVDQFLDGQAFTSGS